MTLRWKLLNVALLPGISSLTEALIYDPPHEEALPKLQKIQIDATPESLEMLQSRCVIRPDNARSALREIILYVKEPFDPDVLFATEIRDLRTTGMNVSLQAMDFYGADQLPLDSLQDFDFEETSEGEDWLGGYEENDTNVEEERAGDDGDAS
ncbi:hypothetical protein C8R44DRAFT_743058 [Mycena epipterygia]|nr:hypothetical protein C8R44DRAFT_743058 [Mycena epipterygia]